MDSVSTLIRDLGGEARLAEILSKHRKSTLTPHAVAKFRVRGIPSRYWLPLSQIAGITFDRLDKISVEAKREAEKRRRGAA